MNNYRKNAIVTGVLYIIGTVAGILSVVFMNPLLNSPDLLTAVSADGSQLIFGALFVLVKALALAMVPVVMFPVLRRHNEVLALWLIVKGFNPTAVESGSARIAVSEGEATNLI